MRGSMVGRLWLAGLLLAGHLGAAEQKTGQAARNPAGVDAASSASDEWRAAARSCGLTQEDLVALGRDRILISGQSCKQIFSPYIKSENNLSFFITSDSVLNAYHSLLEESVCRMERKAAREMPELLRALMRQMSSQQISVLGKESSVQPSRRRAGLVVGVALRLFDETYRAGDAATDALIAEEAQAITAAQGERLPPWLGTPAPDLLAFDYSRFRPRGFYTRSAELERYFRATAWLQAVPFRVGKDEELLAFLLLSNAYAQVFPAQFHSGPSTMPDIFTRYGELAGLGDDFDLPKISRLLFAPDGDPQPVWQLAATRSELLAQMRDEQNRPRINDQIRDVPHDPAAVAEPNLRILSARRLPDAVLFQQTTDPRKFRREFPTGLEVAAALGSTFAQQQLPAAERPALLEVIEQTQPDFNGTSLYCEYLHALRALTDAPEPDAPEFLKTEAWQRKSCNTLLSGWSLLRHTWALQGKVNVAFRYAKETPPGFVEPEPEFFARMARLCQRSGAIFSSVEGAQPDLAEQLERLAWIREKIRGVKSREELAERGRGMPHEEYRKFEEHDEYCELFASENYWMAERKGRLQEYWQSAGEGIDQFTLALKTEGRITNQRAYQRLLASAGSLPVLWAKLRDLCHALTNIAHKQLRHVELSLQEVRLLDIYGETLARFFFYEGNSYSSPRDDAPRATDVFAGRDGKYLHVATGRPHWFYVLYPWHGKQILAAGAVMRYYEFPASARLTDAEWKQRLDSPSAPSAPDWLQPILGAPQAKPRSSDP